MTDLKDFYTPELLNEDARKRKAEAVIANCERAHRLANSDDIDVKGMVKLGDEYYEMCQSGDDEEYNSPLVFEAIETFLPIYTSHNPRYSYRGCDDLDAAYNALIKTVDDYYWMKHDCDLKYKLAIKNTKTHGTGYLLPFSSFDEFGMPTVDMEVKHIGEVFIGDPTEFFMKKQPYYFMMQMADVDSVVERWPHIKDSIDPSDETFLEALKEAWNNLKQMVGLDQDMYSLEDMKREYKFGRCYHVEYYEKVRGIIYRAHYINSVLAEYVATDYKDYMIAPFRNYPRDKHFYGIPEAKIAKIMADVDTKATKSIIKHLQYQSAGIWTYPKRMMAASLVKAKLNVPGMAFGLPDRYLQKNFSAHYPPPLPQSAIQSSAMFREKADRVLGNVDWIGGRIQPGEDPASKVQFLQQAGMARPKLQGQFFDEDGMRVLGRNRLWLYQNRIPQELTIRITNTMSPDGKEYFIDINKEVDAQMMAAMQEASAKGIGFQEGGISLDPAQLEAQMKMYERKVKQAAELKQQVEPMKLNDTSAAYFDTIVDNSEKDPFNEMRRQQSALQMFQLKAINLKELRKATSWSIDAAALGDAPINKQFVPAEQFAEGVAQAMQAQDPQAIGAMFDQMLNYIGQIYATR